SAARRAALRASHPSGFCPRSMRRAGSCPRCPPNFFKKIDILNSDADLITHRADQPDFFSDKLARLFANAVDRPQKSLFRFDRKNREEAVIALLSGFGLTQFLIAGVGPDVLKKDRLATVRHSACKSLASVKDPGVKCFLVSAEGSH